MTPDEREILQQCVDALDARFDRQHDEVAIMAIQAHASEKARSFLDCIDRQEPAPVEQAAQVGVGLVIPTYQLRWSRKGNLQQRFDVMESVGIEPERRIPRHVPSRPLLVKKVEWRDVPMESYPGRSELKPMATRPFTPGD